MLLTLSGIDTLVDTADHERSMQGPMRPTRNMMRLPTILAIIAGGALLLLWLAFIVVDPLAAMISRTCSLLFPAVHG